MTTGRPQHIDRQQLFTSLPIRIAYLKEFLEFTSDDVDALIMGQRYIKILAPAVVNMVYKKLLRHDVTARVFSTRDSRDETDPSFWVKEDGPQIQNRKMFLRWYLTKLNSDPSNQEYWEYLDMVGAMHVGKARRSPLFVDYLFLGATLGYIQESFTEAILSHPKLDLQDKIAIVKAFGKVIWIQNDLMAKWQVKDGVNSEQASITSLENSHLGRVPTEFAESSCPFSRGKTTELKDQRVSLHIHNDPDPDRDIGQPTGVPKLKVVNGQIMGRNKLDLSILEENNSKLE